VHPHFLVILHFSIIYTLHYTISYTSHYVRREDFEMLTAAIYLTSGPAPRANTRSVDRHASDSWKRPKYCVRFK